MQLAFDCIPRNYQERKILLIEEAKGIRLNLLPGLFYEFFATNEDA